MPSIHNISSKTAIQFFLTIPDHGSKILKVKTVLSMLKQAGIDKTFFINSL